MEPEFVKEALACLKEGATESLIAMPAKDFKPLFNEAWKVAYTEHILSAVMQEAGRVRDSAKPWTVPLEALGSALTIVAVGNARGIHPSRNLTRKIQKALATGATEFSALRRGKLSIIDQPK